MAGAIQAQYTASGTPPTPTDGKFSWCQLDSAGNLKVNVVAMGGTTPAALADAVANPTTSSDGAWISAFNGTTWDRIRSGATIAVTTPTGYLDVLSFGKYNATPPTLVDGQSIIQQLDSQGNVKETLATLVAGEDLTNNVLRVRSPATADSTDAWTNYASAVLVGTAGINIKASAGRLRHIIATNKSTTVQYWLLIVNKASAPVANDLPIAAFVLNALTGVTIKDDGQLDFGSDALYCSAGISYALSTTSEKVTLAGSADAMVYARYF
jgi:hypothetical protein